MNASSASSEILYQICDFQAQSILGYLPGIYIFLVIKVLSQRTKRARQRPSPWSFQSVHNPGQVVEPPEEDESSRK